MRIMALFYKIPQPTLVFLFLIHNSCAENIFDEFQLQIFKDIKSAFAQTGFFNRLDTDGQNLIIDAWTNMTLTGKERDEKQHELTHELPLDVLVRFFGVVHNLRKQFFELDMGITRNPKGTTP